MKKSGIKFGKNVVFVNDLKSFPGETRDDAAIFGLYSVLMTSTEPYIVVLSSDMPFVRSNVIDILSKKIDESPDAIVPQWENGYLEPTLAIYKSEVTRAVVKSLLSQKKYQLVEMIKGLKRVTYVPVESLKSVDPELLCLVNINTERDLDSARKKHLAII